MWFGCPRRIRPRFHLCALRTLMPAPAAAASCVLPSISFLRSHPDLPLRNHGDPPAPFHGFAVRTATIGKSDCRGSKLTPMDREREVTLVHCYVWEALYLHLWPSRRSWWGSRSRRGPSLTQSCCYSRRADPCGRCRSACAARRAGFGSSDQWFTSPLFNTSCVPGPAPRLTDRARRSNSAAAPSKLDAAETVGTFVGSLTIKRHHLVSDVRLAKRRKTSVFPLSRDIGRYCR